MQKIASMYRNAGIATAGLLAAASANAAIDTAALTTKLNTSVSTAEDVGVVVMGAVAALVVVGICVGLIRKL